MSVGETGGGSSWFQRYLLPGFALKAVIIGGGYATGRELAEYFVPSGPWGGLSAMLLATLIWSIVAALTFALALKLGAYDYRSFFKGLLGPAWVAFEVAYIIFVVLILAVFGAAAGAIGAATFGWPELAGVVLLAVSIVAVTAWGTGAVEQMFKYVSILLYAVYGLFLILALASFGGLIGQGFANAPPPSGNWMAGGLTYASYNIVGAVVILPVLRHLRHQRDAVVAGLIAGPLSMLPAILFFVAMMAFYPAIGDETLPSDFLLRQMTVPGFHILFQVMIFAALLESGAGSVHAINERISGAIESRGRPPLSTGARAIIGAVILTGCMFVAGEIGLVDLIASGYRFLAWLFLAVFVLPLLTIGTWRLLRPSTAPHMEALP
ncbi:putative membrane protein-like protein precursor [Sphingopyxis sp. LC81]|uniref:YkvI family membrane protein n=1 Tax=Sphingopyxis sp. LC81 TaxID=1502850 RepID=UPI00050E6720|nr:membrane protein [Sphingopyxis sp. LC81]KGB53247.1 putative membrane protein-like protein precursor [Sphingopyxis sp. LC81]